MPSFDAPKELLVTRNGGKSFRIRLGMVIINDHFVDDNYQEVQLYPQSGNVPVCIEGNRENLIDLFKAITHSLEKPNARDTLSSQTPTVQNPGTGEAGEVSPREPG